jgi:2-C-methyl-D-erythritol 4-phosphate cytidylyltransferase
MKPKAVIIVAGGRGERVKTIIPKQFVEIKGRPVIMYTLEVFHQYDANIQIVLVLPEAHFEFWDSLCKKHAFTLAHKCVNGGNTRYESVKNGLAEIASNALVAVHDGVRPLVSIQTITRCFEDANQYRAVVPVIELIESIREVSGDDSKALDRNAYKLVQTPQVFDAELLKNAYKQEFSEFFTDDASVVEQYGAKIYMVEGNRENIKITTALDFHLAETLMENK